MKRFNVLISAALLLVIFPAIAWAASATVNDTTVQITGTEAFSFIQWLASFSGGAGLIISGFAVRSLTPILGHAAAAMAAKRIDDLFQLGISFAVEDAKKRLSKPGVEFDVDTKNQIVATAATYIKANAPGLLKQMGITPVLVDAKIQARLDNHLGYQTIKAATSKPAPAPDAG